MSGLANCTHSRQYRIVTCRVCSRSRVPYAAISHCDPAQPPAYRNAGIQSIHAFVHSWHFSIADIVPGHGSEVLKLPLFFFSSSSSLCQTLKWNRLSTLYERLEMLFFFLLLNISVLLTWHTGRCLARFTQVVEIPSQGLWFAALSQCDLYPPAHVWSPFVKCEFSLSHQTPAESCNPTCGLRDKG